MHRWLATLGLLALFLGAHAAPERIASFSPGATRTLIDLGAAGQIVAATRWCPLPAAHPATRDCDVFNPDLERLLRAKPDLVVLPRTSNPLWAERCRGAGLKVLVLSPESKASVATDIRLIAEALDSPKTQADRLTKELEGIPALKPAKLLIIWDGMMAGPDTYLAVILQRTGFRSALANGGWIKLDWEILAQAQPDAVLWIESGPTDGPVVFSENRKGFLSQVTLVKQLNFYKADLIFETSSGSEWLPGTGLLQIIPKLTALRGKMR
jgi:ABC-type Fe3+-hydroxamate transport system substrate-binding protein